MKIDHAMNPEVVERLELKVAYLERANHELSDVVYRQQRELDDLRARLAALSTYMGTRFNELASHQPPYTDEEERPPHY